jgi:apolipoprotein N-acyltransferase
MELIVARTNPFGTWGSVAFSQYGNQPLMQLASVTGLSGIAFLVSWFGSLANWIWEVGFDWAIVGFGVLIYAGVWSVVMIGGGARLAFVRSKGKTIRVATIGWPTHILRIDELSGSLQPQISDEGREYFKQKFGQIHDWFLANSQREARAGAKVVVWPKTT